MTPVEATLASAARKALVTMSDFDEFIWILQIKCVIDRLAVDGQAESGLLLQRFAAPVEMVTSPFSGKTQGE
jgi:hypothetical protein